MVWKRGSPPPDTARAAPLLRQRDTGLRMTPVGMDADAYAADTDRVLAAVLAFGKIEGAPAERAGAEIESETPRARLAMHRVGHCHISFSRTRAAPGLPPISAAFAQPDDVGRPLSPDHFWFQLIEMVREVTAVDLQSRG